MLLRIEGHHLPGRRCGDYDDIEVGVQRKAEVVEQVPGDAKKATWTFEVTTKLDAEGALDFGGPYVHGKRGERFVYLSWSSAGTMFRRAKLMLGDAPATDGTLVARVHLTDGHGMPMCARLRPPALEWSTEAG